MFGKRKMKKPDISTLEEKDKKIPTKEELQEEDMHFKQHAGFLSSLLKKFKKL